MIDFMLFLGFDLWQTNVWTDICTSRVAFATENFNYRYVFYKCIGKSLQWIPVTTCFWAALIEYNGFCNKSLVSQDKMQFPSN